MRNKILEKFLVLSLLYVCHLQLVYGNEELNIILQGVNYNDSFLKSASAKYSITTTIPNKPVDFPDDGLYSEGNWQIIWAMKEEKVRSTYKYYPKDTTQSTIDVDRAFDGFLSKRLDLKNKTGYIGTAEELEFYLDIRSDVGFFGPRREPWGVILNKCQNVSIRTQEVLGEDACYVIDAIPATNDTLFRLWIVPNKGFRIKRWEKYNDNVLFLSKEVKIQEFPNGIYFPTSAISRTFHTVRSIGNKIERVQYVNVQEFIPNPMIADDFFTIEFLNGMRVFDKLIGTSFIVGGQN